MKIIDISIPIDKSLALWPKSTGWALKGIAKIGSKNHFTETHLSMNLHVGTHIDAPLHFVRNGKTVDEIPLQTLIGRTYVAGLGNAKDITREILEALEIPHGTERILFKTTNSSIWSKKKFNKNYVGLTPGAAAWLVKNKMKLVGIDYLSIAKFSDAVEVHQVLLGGGIVILEGLNLKNVKAQEYTLVCAPIKISKTEAAPVRAILLTT